MTEQEGVTDIGTVVGGGLKDTLQIELKAPVESLRVGEYVLIRGKQQQYFAAITDLLFPIGDPTSMSADWRKARWPAVARQIRRLQGRAQARAMVSMAQRIDGTGIPIEPPASTATIPPLGSPVTAASADDMSAIYGSEGDTRLVIGHTLAQGHPICLDLARLVERPSAVYGTTGTGKSSLVKVILCGIIHRRLAALLVLDMHNDYAYDDHLADGRVAPGLKESFPTKVVTFGLGRTTTVRGRQPDRQLVFSYEDLAPRDLMRLADILALTDNTPTVLAALVRRYKGRWLAELLKLSVEELENDAKAVRETLGLSAAAIKTLASLRTKLGRLERLDYLQDIRFRSGIEELVNHLSEGRSVIVSFGDYDEEIDYLLVANLLMRHITQVWDERANHHRTTGTGVLQPLVIVQEEAHLMLNPQNAAMTAYGSIAREKRKTGLTMLLVDQRPSGIWDEVLSQVGTRLCCWLGDETDVKAALSGLPGKESLKALLASLRPRQEALVMGYGVSMPIAMRIRDFDPAFIESLKRPS